MKRTDITALFPEATDEQIRTLMDINGADINAAKSGMTDLQGQLTAAQSSITELEKRPTVEALAAVQAELDRLKAANAVSALRAAVAKEKGVPAELLTADTEETCKAQADGILAFAKPAGYPILPDGGEAQGAANGAARDRFASWAANNL